MKAERRGLRVVLDTNVLVSAVGFRSERLRKVWDLVEEKSFEAVVSPFILEEFERNLKSKAGFSMEEAQQAIAWVKDFVTVVHPRLHLSVIDAKESDNRILECAVEARADVLLTGNLRHIRPLGRFRGIQILTPREFLGKHFPAE